MGIPIGGFQRQRLFACCHRIGRLAGIRQAAAEQSQRIGLSLFVAERQRKSRGGHGLGKIIAGTRQPGA